MNISYNPDGPADLWENITPLTPAQFTTGVPAVTDPGPVRVGIRVAYTNGAVREYSALHPLGFRLAVEQSGEAAAGRAAGAGHFEPALLVTFSGNPDAGGITGKSVGTPP